MRMEKQKSRNKFLKFLPRAPSAVKFQNPPPFSPGKLKHLAGKGSCSPFRSIIPAEARREPKNSTTIAFEAQEPTSPKVSCMGQIKHKKKTKTEKPTFQPKDHIKPVSAQINVKKNTTSLPEKLSGTTNPRGRIFHASFDQATTRLPDRAPSLSQMNRFASGRDGVRSFDWGELVNAADEDVGDYYSGEESEEEEREGFVPFSAPILVGGGGIVAMEPRKEINLWKRRTVAQLSPLQVNSLVRS